jgi:hypothetical protein
MHNKFKNSNKNKFGSNKSNIATGLTPSMQLGLSTAIPIWELLNMTETEYNLAYKTEIIEKKNE